MNNLDLNKKLLNLMESAMMEKKADKDYDGDGKIESPEDEYKGSKDKAIKKAMGKNVNEAEEKESLDTLKSALRNKMDEMMASTSSMPKNSAPTLDNEGANGYEGYMVGEDEEVDEPSRRPRPQSEIDDDAVDDEVERKSIAFAEKYALRGKDLEKYVGKTVTLWQEGSTNPPIDRKFKIEPGKNGEGISIEGEYYGPEDFVDHNAAADYSWPSQEVANKYNDMREEIYRKAFYYETTLEMEQLRKLAGIS